MAPLPPRILLARRGTVHGRFRPPPRGLPDAATCARRFAAAEAIHLPGALLGGLAAREAAIAGSLALFERLRRGDELQPEVRARLGNDRRFSPSGSLVDPSDPREIEKVFVDGVRGRRFVARGLWAKLSWIAHDERDASLRIRFSFGSENDRDWQKETRRAPWADRYAERVFPECTLLTGRRALVARVERLVGRAVRFSERIVYNNAPGGGAVFHHDCEPHQRGVLFGQLAGETAWLALPKRALARTMAEFARTPARRRRFGTPARALSALDAEDDPAVARLLNETPAFTAALVEAGALFHLRAGDALLLPNHGWNRTCWHSVFALGRRASLAHSYGIFPRRR